jgi:hypothetical protein
VRRLTELGSPDAWGVRMDLLDPKSIDAAFAAIQERWIALKHGSSMRPGRRNASHVSTCIGDDDGGIARTTPGAMFRRALHTTRRAAVAAASGRTGRGS